MSFGEHRSLAFNTGVSSYRAAIFCQTNGFLCSAPGNTLRSGLGIFRCLARWTAAFAIESGPIHSSVSSIVRQERNEERASFACAIRQPCTPLHFWAFSRYPFYRSLLFFGFSLLYLSLSLFLLFFSLQCKHSSLISRLKRRSHIWGRPLEMYWTRGYFCSFSSSAHGLESSVPLVVRLHGNAHVSGDEHVRLSFFLSLYL